MTLLYFQQETHRRRITAPCAYGMDGGNDALAAGCPFCGRCLPSGRPEYPTKSEYASESSNQPY